nr:hypothetical protein [Desulfobacula sp.]
MDKIASLKRLLDPKKIAVIGASKSKEKVGGIVFRRLMDSRRRLFPVNPKETAIEGYKVSPDIRSLPKDIDLAVITLSAERPWKPLSCVSKGGFPIISSWPADSGKWGLREGNWRTG